MKRKETYKEDMIVENGKLTPYGEELYRKSRIKVYDEVQGRWITL